jgi:predicted ATPase
MITYIKINGFKSFHQFEMEFMPFTVIAGANASGKSNLFDALKLLSGLAETDSIKKAFKEQRGEFIELFIQYSEGIYATEMNFMVEMLVNKDIKDAWGNKNTLKYTRLHYEIKIERFTNSSGIEDLRVVYEHLENLKHEDDRWIKIIPQKLREHWRPKVSTGRRAIPYIQTVEENHIPTVLVPQDGTTGNKRRFPLTNATRSILSSFDTIDFPHVLAAKEEIKSWKFLQLNPQDLSKPTNKNTGEDVISESGQNLAGALYRIKKTDEYNLRLISRKLQHFLPNFIEVDAVDDVENKQFIVKLIDTQKKIYTSRVLSEGTLRILALCILEYDDKQAGLLCFEEPENGIHPARIETMAKLLKDLSTDFENTEMPLRQVIVNTHSPVLVGIINKWEYDIHASVWYAYMRSRLVTVVGKKQNLMVTYTVPVLKGNNPQFTIEFSESDKKYTLQIVKNYGCLTFFVEKHF